MCATSSALAPTSVSVAGTWSRSASNARSRTGKPLALNRLADEHDPQRARPPPPIGGRSAARGARGPLAHRQVHSVRHDPVAPAEEPPSCPGRRLGHGDAHAQVVHPAPTAQRRGGDPVGQRVLGVGVKGADERQLARAAHRIPADERNDRLVEVDDVVARLAQLAAQRESALRGRRDIRYRAVGGDADRAPQRDEALAAARACGRAPR